MNKIISYLPIYGMLGLFILIMNSGIFLKNPMGEEDDVIGYLEGVGKNVMAEQWGDAGRNAAKLTKAWDTVAKRIQFSVERNEMGAFSVSLARLQGLILARNQAGALAEIYEAREHWDNLGN